MSYLAILWLFAAAATFFQIVVLVRAMRAGFQLLADLHNEAKRWEGLLRRLETER